jgi:hypothetical protein
MRDYSREVAGDVAAKENAVEKRLGGDYAECQCQRIRTYEYITLVRACCIVVRAKVE